MALDRKIALFLIGLSGFFYYLTFLYPPETMSFPRFLLYAFGLLSFLLFLFPGGKRKYDVRELFAREKVTTFVLAVIYAGLLTVIGFFTASFLFIAFYIWLYEHRGWRKAILIGAVCAVGTYLIFEYFLSVTFPRGFLV